MEDKNESFDNESNPRRPSHDSESLNPSDYSQESTGLTVPTQFEESQHRETTSYGIPTPRSSEGISSSNTSDEENDRALHHPSVLSEPSPPKQPKLHNPQERSDNIARIKLRAKKALDATLEACFHPQDEPISYKHKRCSNLPPEENVSPHEKKNLLKLLTKRLIDTAVDSCFVKEQSSMPESSFQSQLSESSSQSRASRCTTYPECSSNLQHDSSSLSPSSPRSDNSILSKLSSHSLPSFHSHPSSHSLCSSDEHPQIGLLKQELHDLLEPYTDENARAGLGAIIDDLNMAVAKYNLLYKDTFRPISPLSSSSSSGEHLPTSIEQPHSSRSGQLLPSEVDQWHSTGDVQVGFSGEVHAGSPGEVHAGSPGEVHAGSPGEVHAGSPGEVQTSSSGEVQLGSSEAQASSSGEVQLGSSEAQQCSSGKVPLCSSEKVQLCSLGEIQQDFSGESHQH